jgi:anthranilate 1,2-dioxygenase (deaminating, decarboxylating) large subunit
MDGRPVRNSSPYQDFIIDAPPDDFRVRTQVYCDPAVFDDEMRGIFERTWVYVGHDSEVANPGDFKVGALGRLPVIITRGLDQQVRVLLNTCRHRGSIVCRSEKGNAKEFICPYHGWTYGIDGKIIAMSTVRGGYRPGFAQRIGGLVELPRVALYRGMIFASASPDGESLEDYLGLARYYVDLWFDQSPTGRVRLLEPRRAYYRGNWKLQVENSTDGWHARYVHESAFATRRDLGMRDTTKGWEGCTRSFGRGHGLLERPMRTGFAPDIHERYLASLHEAHGAERAKLAHYGRHITLFPNVHLMEFKVRVVQPVAVDKTIVYEFPVEFDGSSEEVNAAVTRRVLNEGSLAAGFVNSDDVEIFARVQSGLKGAALLPWLVMSRGMGEEKTAPSGELVGEENYELPQRAIYREWARLMTQGQ